MQYGDPHTLALRRIVAALRHLAAPDGDLPDTAKARVHLDEAIAEIETAEAAAAHTNDVDAPQPA